MSFDFRHSGANFTARGKGRASALPSAWAKAALFFCKNAENSYRFRPFWYLRLTFRAKYCIIESENSPYFTSFVTLWACGGGKMRITRKKGRNRYGKQRPSSGYHRAG
jgi:hypothetical protein